MKGKYTVHFFQIYLFRSMTTKLVKCWGFNGAKKRDIVTFLWSYD